MVSFQFLWIFMFVLMTASKGISNMPQRLDIPIAVAPLRCGAEILPVAPDRALFLHPPFRPAPAGEKRQVVDRAEQALSVRELVLAQDSSQGYPFGPVESGYGWGWTWWWIVIAGIALFFVLIFAAWGGWSSSEEEPPPEERMENSDGKQR